MSSSESENEDKTAKVIGELEGLSVGDMTSLKALVPDGEEICGISLCKDADQVLIDSALRLTPEDSQDYAFIKAVRESMDNANILQQVLSIASSQTRSGQTNWLSPKAVDEIFACASRRLQTIQRASEAVLAKLQREADQFQGDGETSLKALGEAINMRRQVVPTERYEQMLSETFQQVSSMVLHNLAERVERACVELCSPADLLGEIDEAWKLGCVRRASVEKLNYLTQDHASQSRIQDNVERAKRLLDDVGKARLYVEDVQQRCKRLGLGGGSPQAWLSSMESRWPPKRTHQLQLVRIVELLEGKNAQLWQTKKMFEEYRNQQEAKVQKLERDLMHASQREVEYRSAAGQRYETLRLANEEQAAKIRELTDEVTRVRRANDHLAAAVAGYPSHHN